MLDVDGTLLDPDGTLRPRTAAAVARAAQAGIRPILCTGRRYRRALPIAQQLGLDAPLVCNSGAIIKDPERPFDALASRLRCQRSTPTCSTVPMHTVSPPSCLPTAAPEDADFIIAGLSDGAPAV